MKSPLYKNFSFVLGVALLLLGVGNWVAGTTRAQPYVDYLKEHGAGLGSSRDFKSELLESPDELRQERDITRAKLEFYQVVQSGGRFMVLAGAASMLVGWVRQRRGLP